MNANEFTFGVEIETIVSRETVTRERLNIASYQSSGSQVPYLPLGWVAKSDLSIRAENGYTGCEIVSPILKGEYDIETFTRCPYLLLRHEETFRCR
jgi:hypothetical protein